MQVRAWAVVDKDGINVRTVCSTRIGAIINWLVVAAGHKIYHGYSDDMIEALWKEHTKVASVVEVTVSLTTN